MLQPQRTMTCNSGTSNGPVEQGPVHYHFQTVVGLKESTIRVTQATQPNTSTSKEQIGSCRRLCSDCLWHIHIVECLTMLRAMTPEDTHSVCEAVAQVFCTHEPMCKALGIQVSEFVKQFTPIIGACCSSGLSYMLEDTSGGAGTILSKSLALPYAQYQAMQLDDHPSFRPILAVFDALDKLPSEHEESSVMNFVWSTHSDHMNKGYAKKVVEATMNAAKQAGFRSLIVDVTNRVSQHLLPYFGYQPHVNVRYHDFECFRVIECTEYAIRAVKQLTDDDKQQQDQQQQGPGSQHL